MKKLVKFLLLLITLSAILGLMSCSKKSGDAGASMTASDLKATGFNEVTSFGTNPGQIKMYLYVPANMPSNAPVVFALHGCTQSASAYHQGSGWSELAEKYKFYVIYPEQNSKNNSNSCFNWGGDPNSTLADMDPTGTKRRSDSNSGDENGSMMQMLDYVKANYSVNNKKVFITGLSAGGYFTAMMLAIYPDVFAAGAVMAGGPYLCDRTDAGKLDSNEAYKCLNPGKDKDGAYWASMVAYSGYTKPSDVSWPKVQIWQGTSDYIVYPMNATEVMQQFTKLHGISDTPSETTTLKGQKYEKYKNTSGDSLVEVIYLDKMGHGIAVDPGTADDQGGKAGAYILSQGVFSSYYAAKFFGIIDPQPPVNELTVTLTAPAGGDVNPGSLTIKATATDTTAVTKVEVYENGTLLGNAVLKSGDSKNGSYEYTVSHDSGTYKYSVKAYSSITSKTSSEVTVNFKTVPPVTDTWPAETGTFAGSGSVPQATYYTPAGISKSGNASLVVYLHGCLESDTIAQTNTEWNVQADKYKFFVEYIKSTGVNQCFDWYSSSAQSGGGDTAVVKSLIAKVKAKYPNINKVYLSGLSAGAAMTIQLISLYPTEYAGAVVMSGLPFKGFTGAATSTLSYMSGGDKKTAAQWAALMPNAGPYPPILEIHGTSDTTVAYSFQTAIVKQFTQVQGADQTADSNKYLTTASTIRNQEYKEYWSADGLRLLVATLSINGMGHGITVDPKGTGEDKGGKTASYSFDKQLNSTYYSAKFFNLIEAPDYAPSVSISSPTSGAVLTSGFTVSASASDDKEVKQLDFYVNGALKCSKPASGTSFSSSCSIDVSGLSNGNLEIKVIATDSKPQTAQSIINITLNKPVEEPSVSITEPVNGSKTNASSIIVKANATDNKAVTKVEFYVNEVLKSTVTTAPYEAAIDLSGYAEGTISIKAIAYDADGNTGNNSIAFGYDKTAPVVAFDKTAGTYDSGTIVNFSAGEAVTFFYTIDNNDPTLSSTQGSSVVLTNNSSDPKTITVKAIAKDAAGNISSVKTETYTVVVNDTAAPTEVISSPKETCYSGICNPAQITGNINITGTASDDKGVAKVEVKVYAYKYTYTETNPTLTGTYTATGTTSWAYTVSGLTKYKYYKLEVTATDLAGKTSTVQYVRVFQM